MRIKDDLKLIAQCQTESITHILTEDVNTLAKCIRRNSTVIPVLLKDGFVDRWFNGGQGPLGLPSPQGQP